MENAAFLTEPKIDTSPDALDRVCISLKKFEHETTWMGMAVIYDAAKVLHEVAAEKRRDAELVLELVEALSAVHKIVAEAAPNGFDPHTGDWAERLFFSQRATNAALAKARAQGKKP